MILQILFVSLDVLCVYISIALFFYCNGHLHFFGLDVWLLMCLVGWMPGCWVVWCFGGLEVLCLFVCLFICLSVCLSVCSLSVCLFVCVSVCLCLSVCFWFSISLYIGLSTLGGPKASAIFHLRKFCRKAGPQ